MATTEGLGYSMRLPCGARYSWCPIISKVLYPSLHQPGHRQTSLAQLSATYVIQI